MLLALGPAQTLRLVVDAAGGDPALARGLAVGHAGHCQSAHKKLIRKHAQNDSESEANGTAAFCSLARIQSSHS